MARMKAAFTFLGFPPSPQLSSLGLAEGQACSACMGPPAWVLVGGKQDKSPLGRTGLLLASWVDGQSAAAAAWQAGSWEAAQAFVEMPELALT